jgi:tetratricopeptide (TPR) repeat protein
MMDKNWILIGLIMLVFLVSIVHADTCDKADTEESVLYATQAEDTGRWAAAARNYGNAAICYDYQHDYDNAIKYELKLIEMRKKVGMLYGVSYSLIAHRYSKKGPGFEREIRENCDLAEEELLKEINEELNSKHPSYAGVSLDYTSLSDCFHLINDTEKTCMYCGKSNEYSSKESMIDCVRIYGCLKESVNSPDNSSSGDNSGGFPIVPVVGGLIVLVLIASAFFLLKGKKGKGR